MRTIALTTTLLVLLGQTTTNAQLNDAAGRPSDRVAGAMKGATVGTDRAAAVGHALCMSIEASELAKCAEKSSQGSAGERRDAQANSQETGDMSAALRKHAQSAFAESNRLFAAVKTDRPLASDPQPNQADVQACQAFYVAAWNYSKALEACCKQGGEGNARAAMMVDPARMALINHAVKEAVQSIALRKMIQSHNDPSEASTALLSHAKVMMDSSREALDSADGAMTTQRQSARPVINEDQFPAGKNSKVTEQGADAAPGTGGKQDLVSLARAVVDAVQTLDQGAPAAQPRSGIQSRPATGSQPRTQTPGQDR